MAVVSAGRNEPLQLLQTVLHEDELRCTFREAAERLHHQERLSVRGDVIAANWSVILEPPGGRFLEEDAGLPHRSAIVLRK
jgi:hypothetical protein